MSILNTFQEGVCNTNPQKGNWEFLFLHAYNQLSCNIFDLDLKRGALVAPTINVFDSV